MIARSFSFKSFSCLLGIGLISVSSLWAQEQGGSAIQIGQAAQPQDIQNLQPQPVNVPAPQGPEIRIKEIVNDPKAEFAHFMDINPGFVKDFYIARNFQPLWISNNQWNEKANIALDILHKSQEEGLFPQDYVTHLLPKQIASQPDDDAATMDVRLTSALMQYMSDVHYGRRELRKTNEDREKNNPDPDMHHFLAKALQVQDFKHYLESLPPQYEGYKRLKSVLLKEAERTVSQLPPARMIRGLALNAKHPDIQLLHEHLVASGAMDPSPNPMVFDKTMRDGLKRFQKINNIATTGHLNQVTLNVMNNRKPSLVKKIALNMERWRWLPEPTSGKWVLVNVPGFMMYAYENNQPVFQKKVIVGNEHRETPIFSAPMTSIKFNPNWSVPPKIAAKDILPQIQEDPVHFFSDYGMRVLNASGQEISPQAINWSSITPQSFSFRLKQMPGPKNALGKVRFTIDNPYDIYLHDTSSRDKFAEEVRTLSSGCIRVQDPEILAQFVLNDNKKWGVTQVKAAMQGNQTNVVSLPTPVRVNILYATAYVDDAGELHLYDDVYERDSAVMHLLSMDKKKIIQD